MIQATVSGNMLTVSYPISAHETASECARIVSERPVNLFRENVLVVNGWHRGTVLSATGSGHAVAWRE